MPSGCFFVFETALLTHEQLRLLQVTPALVVLVAVPSVAVSVTVYERRPAKV